MKTDEVEGFLLDRGFQVFFDAYPQARRQLDLARLDLRPFESGALVWDGERWHEVHRRKPFAMAFSPFFRWRDKVRLQSWNQEVAQMSEEEIWNLEDVPAEEHLIAYGFSDEFLERFARPFFGGIFLDRSLQVSLRMFTFVWKMLLEGETTIPARGIEEIPRQIAADLPPESFRFGTRVIGTVRDGGRIGGVQLEDGSTIEAETVVVATDAEQATRLTRLSTVSGTKSSTCLYYAASELPFARPILMLNASGIGRVNHVAPMSAVSPALAPEGRHLVSVTILGIPPKDDAYLAREVKYELQTWFPRLRVDRWQHLRTYRVHYAQMPQPAGIFDTLPGPKTCVDGLFLAGEYTVHSSIEGAVRSGLEAARAITEETAS